MNITTSVSSIDWKSNNKGVWKAIVKDMEAGSTPVFSEGYTATVTGKKITISNSTRPSGMVTYTSDLTDAVAGGVLHGVGTVSDSLEAVAGDKTVRMGSVDLGTLDWNPYEEPSEQRPYGRTVASIPDRNSGTVNLVCSDYTAKYDNQANKVVYGNPSSTQIILIDSSLTGKTGAEIQAALSGVILYYELATPTTSTETAQPLTLQTGVNNLALNERDSSFTLDYTGTEFTLPLDSTHKYAFSDNGTKSIITGSSEQAVTGGQDMLVDVTRMFNGVTADINAITSWADMAAVMPIYNSTVAYNEGEVVGRSGGVTTAKWNQFAPAFSLDGTTLNLWGGSSSVTCVVNGNTSVTCTATAASIIGISSMLRNVTGHKVFCQAYVTANAEKSNYFFYLYNNYFGSDVTWTINQRTRCACILNCTTTSSYTFGFRVQADTTMTVEDLMFIDLTLIYGAGHEPATVAEFEADCAKWGKDLSQYQSYDAGTPMGGSATFTGLNGIGTVRDTQDIITGEKNIKFGVRDMGTLGWSTNGLRWYAVVSGIKAYPGATVTPKIRCGIYPTVSLSAAATDLNYPCMYQDDSNRVSLKWVDFTSQADAQQKLSGVMLIYELATPTTSTETVQPLTAVKGLNNVHENNMTITSTPITMTYIGTDQTITTDTTHKYLQRIDSVETVVSDTASIDVVGKRDVLIDLTYMFGAGNEPTTASDFYKLFPTWQGYAIPYNKGNLLNFKGTGLKSVGFNLLDLAGRTLGEPQNTTASNTTIRGPFDETKFYLGMNLGNWYIPGNVTSYEVTSNSVEYTAKGGYGIGFPIRCVPGRTYRVEGTRSSSNIRYGFSYYTYGGQQIGYSDHNGAAPNSVTPPEGTYWLMLICSTTIQGSGSISNLEVHLVWSGGRNGDYEPYWDFTRQLPTLTYFPDGMNGVGQVHDEITSRQAIKRLTEVDLEDLTWTEGTDTWTTTLTGVKSNTTAIAVPNSYSYSLSGTSLTITSDVSPTGKLVYELSTPVTTTFPEEAAVTAQVSDYGTESVVPVNGYVLTTAPFLGIVKYQDNYARTITKLPENYQSQNSMDNLQTVLSALLNVTLTSSYDNEHQDYNYTVTGDGVPGLIAAALTALAPVTGLTFLGNSYTPTEGVVALPDPRVQSITTIPASTSSYTLTEGTFEQAPNATPTFVLPEITDTSVVHTIKLTIKTKTGVTSVNFKDSGNQAVTPETIDGTVEAGDLVEYTCKYESLLDKWVVYPRIIAKA